MQPQSRGSSDSRGLALVAWAERVLALPHTWRPEDYVREELVLPLLRVLGYGSTAYSGIVRGYRRASPVATRERAYLLPDLILTVLGRPVWIVEAKSTKVRLLASAYLKQIWEYARDSELACTRLILTNGFQVEVFDAASGDLRHLDRFNAQEIAESPDCSRRMLQLLGPEAALLGGLSLDEVFAIYHDGDWPTRLLCMRWFADYATSPDGNGRARKEVQRWLSGDVRERVLPGLMFVSDAVLAPQLLTRALGDSHDAVRDTFYTAVRSMAGKSGFRLPFGLDDCEPDGWFSCVVYCQMLAALAANREATTRRQRLVIDRQIRSFARHHDPQVRFFAELARLRQSTGFPMTAFGSVPQYATKQEMIHVEMAAVTIRQSVDADYAEESRRSAIDAIREGARLGLISYGYLNDKLPREYRHILASHLRGL